MANMKHFFQDRPLTSIRPMLNEEFSAMFGQVRAKRSDSFSRLVGTAPDGTLQPMQRAIAFKSNPKLHACGPRCMSATGHDCECACGGKNHGLNNS